jgi:exonuclease SbcC
MSSNEARLQSLTITNFRSIRETVPIDLDAPVVLLHGQNGAGKTTVMSAIELALNGQIADLEDSDREHLVHHGAKTAIVELSTSIGSTRVSTRGGKPDGDPVLTATDARFFTERCYLAQRRLGRLLEIYASAPPNSDSPLTRFVKDLLGLDELDSLIDGLEPVRDIRLIKKLIPEYTEALSGVEEQRGELAALRLELHAAAADTSGTRQLLSKSLDRLGAPATADPALDTTAVAKWLTSSDEESELEPLETAAREIARARSRAEKLAKGGAASHVRSTDKEASTARDAADRWWELTGSKLETVLDELRTDVPTVATAIATDPAAAHQEAQESVNAELERTKAALKADEHAASEIKKIDGRIRTARKRLEKIDRELASGGAPVTSRDLAAALAALVPHLHGDDCPVCGRDYREIGGTSLASHLAEEVSKLGAHAERLQELAAARLEAVSAADSATEQREIQSARLLDDDARDTLNAKLVRFNSYKSQLARLKAGVRDGAGVVIRAAEAERRRAVAQRSDRAIGDLANTLDDLCSSLGLNAPNKNETPDKTIARLERHVTPRIKQIEARQQAREQARRHLDDLERLAEEQRSLEAQVGDAQASLANTQEAVKALEKRRGTLKRLREESQDSRTQVIRQVFNSSLNHMWRDLFVRLAPNELYVPAFLVPSTGDRTVTANLTTTHRDGTRAGSPAAMLSAGNLNTAALTLFLALHLTAKPALPWLLLDDPVQSMDEVHVAQFAAVLRTLARQLGKRIIIAVHERALFDYLALELSPAQPGETLITIEMTRNPDGASTLTPSTRKYRKDPALAAA